MIDVLTHIVNAAVAANSTDKYGFPSGGRRQCYDKSTSQVMYLTPPGGGGSNMTYQVSDYVREDAVRQRGDFHTPTPYSISQTKEQSWTGQLGQARLAPGAWKPWIRRIPAVRSGSVNNFGLLKDVEGQAASMLNAKILDSANQWSAMVDAAELGQTVGLLGDLSRSFLGITTGIIRRDPGLILESFGVHKSKKRIRYVRGVLKNTAKQGGTVGDAAAELWLQYRYGIRPLVKSLEDYQKALTEGYEPEMEFQVTYSKDLSWVASEAKPKANSFTNHLRETGYAKRSVRFKAVVSFADSLKARIRGNPVAEAIGTIWELIPFSFVFDWVVGVGDYINQLNLPTLLSKYRCVMTVKDLTRFEGHSLSFTSSDPDAQFRPTGPLHFNRSETRSFKRAKRGIMLGDIMWGSGLSPTLRKLDAAALTFAKVRRLNASTFH